LIHDPRIEAEGTGVHDPVPDGVAADVEGVDGSRLLAGDEVQLEARRACVDD
jgi:hypothetical protein